MIKTICFDLGDDKELHLTIDEIIKLQSAFRFVCLDQYAEPAKPLGGTGFETFAKAIKDQEAIAKARQHQEAFNRQIKVSGISNTNPLWDNIGAPPSPIPCPNTDNFKLSSGALVSREELEAAQRNQDAFTRAAEASITGSIERLRNGS